ncbi:MAG TPA: hypothetical protein VNO50_21470 [Pyrinomonadaceae bacterium]|nr:hypothetical protein [Pyrinomonadaceae bacterium]
MTDLRAEIVENLLDSCKAEYSEAAATFTALDTKAQNTITVSGIFLAAALAFFRGAELQQLVTIGGATLILLAIVVLVLMLAIIFCIWGMRIRDVPIADAAFSEKEARQILKEPAESLNELFEGHLFDQARNWNSLSSAVREANDRKAWAVRWGQLLLGSAILLVALLLIYTLYSVWSMPPAVKVP